MLELNPNFAIGYRTLAAGYQALDRLAEVEQSSPRIGAGVNYPDAAAASLRPRLSSAATTPACSGLPPRRESPEPRRRSPNTKPSLMAHSWLVFNGKVTERRYRRLGPTDRPTESAALLAARAGLWDGFFRKSRPRRPAPRRPRHSHVSRQRDVHYGVALALPSPAILLNRRN